MPGLSVVSVDALDTAAPIQRWEEAVSSCVGRVPKSMHTSEQNRCEALGTQPFSGRIEYGDLADISFCRMYSTANRFSRMLPPGIAANVSPLMVVSQQRGHSLFEHNRRLVSLQPGDWCLLDTRHPFTWTNPATSELIILAPPRPADGDLSELIERSLALKVGADVGASRIMNSVLLDAFNQMGHLAFHGAHGVAAAVTSLLWGALQDEVNLQHVPVPGKTQCDRLKRYIESQLADPDLSVEAIAEQCQMSVRSVHRAFAENIGDTVSEYIWRRRLAHCAVSLRDPGQSHRSITDIALSWGFGNSSHFSRAFRLSMGTSPRTYRAMAAQQQHAVADAAMQPASLTL